MTFEPIHKQVAVVAVLAAVVAGGLAIMRGTATEPADARRSVVPSYTADPYRGLGTWVDVFDFSPRFAGEDGPTVTPADVDRMAAAGIETLFLQAGRDDERIPGGIVEPELVAEFLRRAHGHGMSVVAWYLPEEYDLDDVLRVAALRDFAADGHRFDGVALDIEARATVTDAAERNRRLVEFSRAVREEFGDAALGVIVLPTVLLEVVNPSFWPDFPWRDLAPLYDVWLPMAYWTDRTWASGYRDAGRYVDETLRRMEANLGRPVALHPIGGIGDGATADDYRAFAEASRAHGAMGISVYDHDTTAPHHWPVLREAAP